MSNLLKQYLEFAEKAAPLEVNQETGHQYFKLFLAIQGDALSRMANWAHNNKIGLISIEREPKIG